MTWFALKQNMQRKPDFYMTEAAGRRWLRHWLPTPGWRGLTRTRRDSPSRRPWPGDLTAGGVDEVGLRPIWPDKTKRKNKTEQWLVFHWLLSPKSFHLVTANLVGSTWASCQLPGSERMQVWACRPQRTGQVFWVQLWLLGGFSQVWKRLADKEVLLNTK